MFATEKEHWEGGLKFRKLKLNELVVEKGREALWTDYCFVLIIPCQISQINLAMNLLCQMSLKPRRQTKIYNKHGAFFPKKNFYVFTCSCTQIFLKNCWMASNTCMSRVMFSHINVLLLPLGDVIKNGVFFLFFLYIRAWWVQIEIEVVEFYFWMREPRETWRRKNVLLIK